MVMRVSAHQPPSNLYAFGGCIPCGFIHIVAATPQLYPIGTAPNLLTMQAPTFQWLDSQDDAINANSISLSDPLSGNRNTSQRYFIEQMSLNNRLQGSSQIVGGRSSAGCNQVNTYLITGRGTSARGATKFVQSYYSVLSCT